jgi:hypothetical protein
MICTVTITTQNVLCHVHVHVHPLWLVESLLDIATNCLEGLPQTCHLPVSVADNLHFLIHRKILCTEVLLICQHMSIRNL